jgi:hypothetical protein
MHAQALCCHVGLANGFVLPGAQTRTVTFSKERGAYKLWRVEHGSARALLTSLESSARGTQALSAALAERSKAARVETLRFLVKLKSLLLGNGFTEDGSGKDGKRKFGKEALAGLGLNALLAYGFVSNVSYITCLILSWVSHGKLTGLSPLAPGQKKQFLAIYGGFWVTNNILRPLRFSLSLVLTPFFNKLIDLVQGKTGFKRATSTGIVVFLVNVCGTVSYLVLGLIAATTMASVPLLP